MGNPRELNATITCSECDPVTIIGASPIEIRNLTAAEYTVAVFAVNVSGERLEDNTIVKMLTVSPGMDYLNFTEYLVHVALGYIHICKFKKKLHVLFM